jgi:hypothetical protein
MITLLLGLLFGLLQGLRHAFEPDHVVAISTLMVSGPRTNRARVAYAAAWGMGHAAMLVLVGGILMLLRTRLPPRVDAAFELAVSLMLIALGMRAVLAAVRAATSSNRDGAITPRRSQWQGVGPLAIGMVHGLAGSGALTALVVARLPSPVAGLCFMVVFGAGAMLGMSTLAGIAGVPLSRILRRRWGIPALLAATGSVSLLLGVVWLVPALHVVVAL